MPVEVKKDRATLTCNHCGMKLEVMRKKGAAPELSACEEAKEKHGWGYTLGFFSMLAGPDVWCGPCARPSEYPEKWEQILWEDVTPGQKVWLRGTHEGEFKAYGPHEVVSVASRSLLSGTPGREGNQFVHMAEDLLIRTQNWTRRTDEQ